MDGEPVALMFAEHPQYQGQGKRIFEVFSQSSWGDFFASLAFGNPEKILPLQAADLFVYEKTRREVARISNPDIPMRPALKILSDSDVLQIDLPHSPNVLARVIDSLKNPGPKA
jgi:hypothetical protein